MSLISTTAAMLHQMSCFIEDIDNTIYTKPLDVFGRSSIGQHFRHIHGFFDCLFKGIDAGVVNYDKRDRQPSIENDCECCRLCFVRFVEDINHLNLDQEIYVQQGMGIEQSENKVKTSVGRELLYALDHAIHHLAMIKIGMRTDFPDVKIDPDLGVAPSTLEYRKRVCAQ